MRLYKRSIFAQVAKREAVPESTLSCFPTSTKCTLVSLKTPVQTADILSQVTGYCCEMGAFGRSSESLAPSVPLAEVRPDGASGALARHSAFDLAFLSLRQLWADGEDGLG